MSAKTKSALYFDCHSGISGDMFLGALIDLGADLKEVRSGLSSLGLHGVALESRRVKRGPIHGTKIRVVVKKGGGPQKSRNLEDIRKLIEKSGLPGPAKKKSIALFERLGKAEAKVHRIPLKKIHFHEVGAVDSIFDIVGSVLAVENLKVSRILSSPVNTGEGVVTTEHGVLPVPAPATAELLKGIPCFSSGVKKELATPTGAALIGFFAEKFQSMPEMTLLGTGYGAGDHIIENSPNLLRVILGETPERLEPPSMIMVETNIDDMNPQFYDHVMESLFKAGAADVFFTPIMMKKNRPATQLSVLVDAGRKQRVVRILLSETSTFGVRFYEAGRTTLEREVRTVKTPYGNVRVKIGLMDGAVVQISPEYDDCKKIAKREKLPVKTVYDQAASLAVKCFGGKN